MSGTAQKVEVTWLDRHIYSNFAADCPYVCKYLPREALNCTFHPEIPTLDLSGWGECELALVSS